MNLSNDYLGTCSILLLFMLYLLSQKQQEKNLHFCIQCSLFSFSLEAPRRIEKASLCQRRCGLSLAWHFNKTA